MRFPLSVASNVTQKNLPMKLASAAALLFLGIAACEPLFLPTTFSAPVFDDDGNVVKTEEVSELKFNEGKITVAADVLNRGKVTYRTYCSSCHGLKGDGQGPSAKGLLPPPRNFTPLQVVFKFASVKAGDLPTDDDLVHTVRTGLHGTAMLQWDISEARLREVLQYIKTFSSRWKGEGAGAPVVIGADPFGDAKKAEAIAKGKQLYYTTPSCHLCHPVYVDQAEYDKLRVAGGKEGGPLRADASWSIAKPSEAFGVNVVPPDFTWHQLRSITQVSPTASAAEQAKLKTEQRHDLFRAIATGIGGTAMPTWKDAITDDEIWALAYYVESLMELRDEPAAREAFMAPLRKK
jgi:mono/diheme cytochrome c family protein